jgi:hypothetical protein
MVSAFPVPPFRAVDFRFNVSTLPGAYSPESAPGSRITKPAHCGLCAFRGDTAWYLPPFTLPP